MKGVQEPVENIIVYSACDFVCKINTLVARVVWKMDLL